MIIKSASPLIECGDAKGLQVIAHPVNMAGKWDDDTCKQISSKWKDPEHYYTKQVRWSRGDKMGRALWSSVEDSVMVCSLVCEQLVGQIVFKHLELSLENMLKGARAVEAKSLHFPYFEPYDSFVSFIEEQAWDFEGRIYIHE